MPLPAGITTCTVSAGPLVDFAGDDYVMTVEWQPVLDGKPGSIRSIVWAATGEPLVSMPETITSTVGEEVEFDLPHVDQAGFIDGTGAAVTGWFYKVTVKAGTRYSQRYSKSKSFQVVVGQSTADFDLIADGTVVIPATTPTPTVTSVNGDTGAIAVPTTADLAAETTARQNADTTNATAISDETAARIAADALKVDIASIGVTVADVRAAVRGNRVAFLGDSIMCAQGSDPMASPDKYGLSMPSYFHYLSKGRVLKTRQAGVVGNTAAQMLARFDTDVTPYRPSVVVIMAGTNDTNDASPTSLASYITTMRALVAKVRAIGAQPVLSTIPPNVISVARQSRTTQFNAWIKAYCAGAATDGAGGWATEGAGIPCPDSYSFFTDPTAGGYLSTYLLDGTHPNNPGYTGWAAFMWAQLSAFFPAVDPLLPADNIDPNNLLSNGLNLTTTGSGISLMPTGWTVQSGVHPTGVTGSLVTGDTTIKGNWWRVVADGSASATNNESQTVSGNYAVGHPLAGTAKIVPGHKYAHCGRFKATGLRNADTGSGSSFLLGTAFNSTLNNALYDFRAASTHFYDVAEGVYYQEMTAPVDASSALVRRQLLNTTAGAGTFQVAQSGFYDLTAMGLA